MNIYLDIDGVLLKKHGGPADNVLEFLKYITENFDCYWLTTHCRNGEDNCIEYLSDKLPKESLQYLEKIKPAYWDMLKTEGIDFSKDFRWFDDYLMKAEEKVLLDDNSYFYWYKVDLEKYPNSLSPESWKFEPHDLSLKDKRQISGHLIYDKEEFEFIKEGYYAPEKGYDERWRFIYIEPTLYILRSWTNWVNFAIEFRKKNGLYESSLIYSYIPKASNDNSHIEMIVFAIHSYLLKEKMFSILSFVEYIDKPNYNFHIHGFNHWHRVQKIGHYLCDRNGADKKVIDYFAYFHDISRKTEGSEFEHGQKSAQIIRKYFEEKERELELTQEQYNLLLEAVSNHDNENSHSDNLTVQTCWDADRLDLWRLRIVPDPDLLNTEIAKQKETIEWAKQFNQIWI